MTTPRVFIIRHGETEWSVNGRHTGTSDIPLTANGEKRIRATGRALVGPDRLIIPSNLAHIYVSPRKRAQRTLELLNLGCKEPMPWSEKHPEDHDTVGVRTEAKIEIVDSIREWDYGDYEGVTSHDIQKQRKEVGEDEWDIWRDGCPGGE
jgi:broad specificity phosphatase PhoE